MDDREGLQDPSHNWDRTFPNECGECGGGGGRVGVQERVWFSQRALASPTRVMCKLSGEGPFV